MNQMDRNALLIAFGYPVQYRALRCAAMMGLKVYVLGTEQARALRYSRYCAGFSPLQQIKGRQEERLPEFELVIKQAVADLRIDLLLPSDRDSIWLLTKLRDRLDVPVFPVPETSAFNRIDDKWTFRELCIELGIPTPRSWLFDSDEDLFLAARLGELPDQLIVKPTRMSGEAGVIRIERWRLVERLRSVTYRPLLVQEFIPGVDYHCTIVSVRGEPCARLTYVDRPEAKYFGCDTDILPYAEQIVTHLKLNGIFNFDTRRTADGRIYFLECNPRPFMSMHMCAQAGVNCFEIGLRAMDGVLDSTSSMEVKSLKKWRGLARGFFRPWELSRGDFGRLIDGVRDPVPILHETSEFLSGRSSSDQPAAGMGRFVYAAKNAVLTSAGTAVRFFLGPERRTRFAK